MQINYPTKIRWHRSVPEHTLSLYSKKTATKLRSSINRLRSANISVETKPLDADFITNFTPLYRSTIDEKENPQFFDLYERTLGRSDLIWPLFSQSVYEADRLIGGAIFSVRETMLAIHFRAFERSWQTVKLPVSPSLVGDYLTAEHAHTLKKDTFSYGVDRNPYGIYADIGLASFKLSVGCQAKTTTSPDFTTIDIQTITQDCLILRTPESEDDLITKAVLYVADPTAPQWLQLQKYPSQLEIEILQRSV